MKTITKKTSIKVKSARVHKSAVDSGSIVRREVITSELFPRRILLAVTGMTPQVVTETLYALAVDGEKKFIPTEIHVITTVAGAKQVRHLLLDAKSGHFHALCREYGLPAIKFPDSHIHVILDPLGQPLADIRTPQDNLRAADFISHLVRDFCLDDDAALHVSIAGGRKSMGFFVGYALSMFGRVQDSLSHVLVNDPFESLPDFFYPPKIGRVLIDRNGSPAHTDEAQIMLADIPFVRLRGGIPSSLMTGDVSFAEVINGVQSGLNFVSLEFDIPQKAICFGGKWITFQPAWFTFYLWLAKRCADGLPEGGALCRSGVDPAEYLKVYAEVVGSNSAHFESVKEHALRESVLGPEFFEQKVSKINDVIKKNLPLEYRNYQIRSFGRKPFKKDALRLMPEQITLSKAASPIGYSMLIAK